MPRVFVVGTGRCGTSTFYQACRQIKNYTCGHESQAGVPHSIEYPNNHIEVAGQLSMQMGRLINRYPNSLWVHLVRDRASCIESIANTAQVQLDAWARHWLQLFQADPKVIAPMYYDCLNANIAAMLQSQSRITVHTGDRDSWLLFWNFIGAEGDSASAQEIWTNRKYNARGHRGRNNYVVR